MPSPLDPEHELILDEDAQTVVPAAPVPRAAPSLESLLASAKVWRSDRFARVHAEPSGLAGLDALLPGGGWPVGALTELLLESEGIGELSLVLPWLARLTQAGGRAALIDPPYLPYAPAIAAAGLVLPRLLVVRPQSADGGLWALEQALKNGACGAVLGWVGFANARLPAADRPSKPRRAGDLGVAELRRLQLAAETGRCTALMFRPATAATQPSTAALRLRLSTGSHGKLRIEILRARGGVPAELEVAA